MTRKATIATIVTGRKTQHLIEKNFMLGTPARTHTESSSALASARIYDVIGMDELVSRLRKELMEIHSRTDGLDSINKLSAKTNISRAYLAKFRDGGMVCMNIMNRIACAFNIKYMIENYDDPKPSRIE